MNAKLSKFLAPQKKKHNHINDHGSMKIPVKSKIHGSLFNISRVTVKGNAT